MQQSAVNRVAIAGDQIQVPLRRYISLEGVVEQLELCQTVVDGQRRQNTIVLTGYRGVSSCYIQGVSLADILGRAASVCSVNGRWSCLQPIRPPASVRASSQWSAAWTVAACTRLQRRAPYTPETDLSSLPPSRRHFADPSTSRGTILLVVG